MQRALRRCESVTQNQRQIEAFNSGGPETTSGLTVLLVDDSRLQRRLVSMALHKRGFRVVEADSAEQGFHAFQNTPIDIVISDWVMPGMNGPAFCRKLRAHSKDRYLYIILLTAKTTSAEITEGFDAGADDFLSKPVNALELAARMGAGQRILHFERELKRANALLSETLGELQSLYHALDADLASARTLQQSLVREKSGTFGHAEVAILLESSGHVGGDLVGFFPVNTKEVCIYAIDVSGHGVSSALLTARLAGVFSGQTPGKNIAIREDPSGALAARDPADIARDLNQMLLEEIETDHYFTMFLCILDTATGRMRYVQAGHPNAVLIHPDGSWGFLGNGGFPIGMLPFAYYDCQTVTLNCGDRVLLSSDGMTECTNSSGHMLDEEGLALMTAALHPAAPEDFLKNLYDGLVGFAGRRHFDDDVSAVLLQF
jgi:sigma-B regulation protein RsbU (phosphoserine phosphatase)